MTRAGGRGVVDGDHHRRAERHHQRTHKQGNSRLGRRLPVAGAASALGARVRALGAGLQQHRSAVPVRRRRLQRHVRLRSTVRRRRDATSPTLHRHHAGRTTPCLPLCTCLYDKSQSKRLSINQSIKFISKCKNSAHSKHVMHLGGTARRIALTAAQCYSFIYKLEMRGKA